MPEINVVTDSATLEQIKATLGDEKFEKISLLTRSFITPLLEDMEEGIGRFFQNIARSHTLIEIYRTLNPKDENEKAAYSDLLRSAVVFAHASLEDMLRTLATNFMPEAGETVLDNIPLKGLNNGNGRAEKFTLGKLAQHRGKLVEELIRESVEQHLERSNYNNTVEIAALLQNIGLDPSEHKHHFRSLDEMMRRRHQIVHRADRLDTTGHESWYVRPIEVEEVNGWITTLISFATEVMVKASLLKSLDFDQFAENLKEVEVELKPAKLPQDVS